MAPYSSSLLTLTSEESVPGSDAVVIVTPYSTGCCIALELQDRGYKVICLWSKGISEAMRTQHVPVHCRGKLDYVAQLDEADTIGETAAIVLDVATKNRLNILACVCGGDGACYQRFGLHFQGIWP